MKCQNSTGQGDETGHDGIGKARTGTETRQNREKN